MMHSRSPDSGHRDASPTDSVSVDPPPTHPASTEPVTSPKEAATTESAPAPQTRTPALPHETDLYCPHCEYNLTGLTENRCPECGRPFDPDDLAQRCSLLPRPLSTWPARPDLSGPFALAATVTDTWFRPAQFAKAFPFVHTMWDAWFFAFLVKVIAFVLGLGSILTWMLVEDLGYETLTATLMAGIATAIAAQVCEVVLAGCLAGLVRPHGRPDAPRFTFWLGITLYTSSFLPLNVFFCINATMLVFKIIDSLGSASASPAVGWLFYIPIFMSIVFWWFSLARMILARGVGMRLLAILVVPVVGVAAIPLAVLLLALMFSAL